MKHNQLIIETDIPAKMRDGVTLYADIYRPADEGKYPVLLTRLPYSKSYGLHFIRPNILAEQGYIVIVQDVRGRYTSEGEFVPYIAEVDDGYDTIEWAANLPYANGDVGMFGLSYYGYTQILAAISGNKHLKAIAPIMAQNSMTDVFNDHDGALELGMWETWNLESMLPNMLARKYKTRAKLEQAVNNLMKNLDNLDTLYKFKPYKDWPAIGCEEMPYFAKLLNYEPTHNHWKAIDAKSNYEKINVPGLHVAGWYDCFLDKTIANFQNGHSRGFGDRLVIGPWTHANFGQMIGDRDFGMAANAWGEASMHKQHIEWFNHWLKQEPIPENASVSYFVMGLNEWKTTEEWPPKNATNTPLYFQEGEVSAKFTPPTTSSEATFSYDPENPVPSNGGGTLHKELHADGPRNQQTLEHRDDILYYSTAPLEEALEVTGQVEVKLWAKTDAPNTDFTAKLVDVFPDGTAFNLADGIIRAAKQHGDKVQNNINEYTINLWATSNLFQKGHQIRIEISSSNFPRFDPNPNTGKSFINSTESQIANQTIYHSPEYPSHILLPIISSLGEKFYIRGY